MAEALPGFSPEESDVLRQAFDTGRLTDEEKKWVLDRVDKAQSAVEGDVTALGPQEPEKPFSQRAMESLLTRETAAGVGGAVGTAVGIATAPGTLVGPIIGGPLGSAAASSLFDNVSNLRNYILGNPERIGLEETTRNLIGEGLTDMAFTLGGAVAQPLRIGRSIIAGMSGLREKASMELMLAAEEAGIRLGAVDAGGSFPKGYAKTIGVFPFSGTPFRRAQIEKLGDVNKALDDILDTFGPNEKLASEIGLDMYEAARTSREEFRNVAGGFYDSVRSLINDAKNPHIIPTVFTGEEGAVKGLKVYAIEQNDVARRGAILLNDGTFLPRPQSEEIASFFEQWARLPDLINPTQYERLTDDLKTLIQKNLKDGFDVKQLSEAKKVLREGFDHLRTDLLDVGEGEAIKKAAETANNFYSKGIVKYKTVVAKTFERVNKFIFRAGADEAGSLNADEIYHTAINLRSPQQIQDLVKLVGKENVANAARENFRLATEAARVDVKIMGQNLKAIDPVILERQLGLTGAGSKKIEGLNELYKTAGVDPGEIKNLIGVIKKLEGIGDPAEFMRRRIIIGGVGAAAAVLGVGGAAAGGSIFSDDAVGGASHGLLTIVGISLLGRYGSKILADNQNLKLLTSALDESLGAIPRRANLARLINVLVNNEPQVPQTRLDDEIM